MSFESLRHIVSRSVRHPQTNKDLQIARIFAVLRLVLDKFWGEERSAFIVPVSFTGGALKCSTTSPVAKQQFSVDGARIKNELNRQLGNDLVKSIVISWK